MPTITFRVSKTERDLFREAAARSDMTLSAYIRQSFIVLAEQPVLEERLAGIERRLSRLEQRDKNAA